MCSEGARCDAPVSVSCGKISTRHISSKRHVAGVGSRLLETGYGNECGRRDIGRLMNL